MRNLDYLRLKMDYLQQELERLPKCRISYEKRYGKAYENIYVTYDPLNPSLNGKRFRTNSECGRQKKKEWEERCRYQSEYDELKALLEVPLQEYKFPVIRPYEHFKNGKEFWDYVKANADSNDYFAKPDNSPVVNNTLLRSKSEQMLALVLKDMRIEFVYEPKIKICGIEFIPDFAIYIRELDKVIFIEHFGMMSKQSYREKNAKKIKDYLEVGLLEGRDIVFFFESDNIGIDSSVFEGKINAAIMANIS